MARYTVFATTVTHCPGENKIYWHPVHEHRANTINSLLRSHLMAVDRPIYGDSNEHHDRGKNGKH